MKIDWSKAPVGTTGAMVADFNGGTVKRGEIEWIPSSITPKGQYQVGAGAWVYHEAPQQWDGEGLPPVGTVCENLFPRGDWVQIHVVAHDRLDGEDRAVFRLAHTQTESYFGDTADKFRPIRTAEQIAAEERESHINGMLCHDALGGTRRGLAEALYDAGYRKQASSEHPSPQRQQRKMARRRKVQQQAGHLRRVEAGIRAKALMDDRPVRFEISGVDQMSLTIISSQMTGIFKRLQSLGMVDAQSVKFERHPVRINGMWRCTVAV